MPRSGSATAPRRSRTTPCARSSGPSGWTRPAACRRIPSRKSYRQAQLALYRDVAGRDYDTANEVTAFDIEAAVRRPFPYSTGSSVTTGEQLMAVGWLVRAMALPPGSRIVEFGPGWGNTTLALARLGHHVTVVDIEPHFCELIRRRAAQEGVEVEVVQDDFLWAERCGQRFDAALFYECFHHCADHLRLLRALREAVVPDGRVFFAGEPITRDFPMPWGLRIDGNSLWAIRKNGWLELGFRDDYFARALGECGWYGLRRACADPGWLTLWEARRRDQPVFRAGGGDTRPTPSAAGGRAMRSCLRARPALACSAPTSPCPPAPTSPGCASAPAHRPRAAPAWMSPAAPAAICWRSGGSMARRSTPRAAP